MIGTALESVSGPRTQQAAGGSESRMAYSRPGCSSIHLLDEALALPARSSSYELQRHLVKAAVLNPFHESVSCIAGFNGDFDAYWLFHIQQEQPRFHPGDWTVVPE